MRLENKCNILIELKHGIKTAFKKPFERAELIKPTDNDLIVFYLQIMERL